MNKMKKVFKVAIYELKLMCFSSKFLILSVLAFIIMDVISKRIQDVFTRL